METPHLSTPCRLQSHRPVEEVHDEYWTVDGLDLSVAALQQIDLTSQHCRGSAEAELRAPSYFLNGCQLFRAKKGTERQALGMHRHKTSLLSPLPRFLHRKLLL